MKRLNISKPRLPVGGTAYRYDNDEIRLPERQCSLNGAEFQHDNRPLNTSMVCGKESICMNVWDEPAWKDAKMAVIGVRGRHLLSLGLG